MLENTISTARQQTIQSQVNDEVYGGISLVRWMAQAGLYMSPWWSAYRDTQLRSFWKKTDHLAGAVFTMTAKMTAIPFKIIPRSGESREQLYEGIELTESLRSTAQFGEGWTTFYSRFVEDLVTQDNGAFAEIIGPGKADGPLTGPPTTIAHLDSARCTRTGNVEFPVIYTDKSGKRYKLHYTRVMFAAQQSSPIADMFGVGFSSVSRCVNVAQNLLDILTYKQEKLGSRPHREIVITKGGLDPTDLQSAFQMAESATDSMGLSRYSKVVVAGSSTIEDAGVDIIELSSLPDGFDEQTSITLGMASIALAFGVDARELFPAMTAGATRADALLQHLKQRGKGPGQILEITEQMFNHKFLPPYLRLVFDFQDDAEDRQVADIKKVRAERRQVDMTTGIIDNRTAREQMLESGDIDRAQFERMELNDGRLDDGSPTTTLFYSKDRFFKKYLTLEDVEDPLDMEGNKLKTIQKAVTKQVSEVNKFLSAASEREKWMGMRALAALENLLELYEERDQEEIQKKMERQQTTKPPNSSVRGGNTTTPNTTSDAGSPDTAKTERSTRSDYSTNVKQQEAATAEDAPFRY